MNVDSTIIRTLVSDQGEVSHLVGPGPRLAYRQRVLDDRPALVLLHGLSADGSSWQPVIDRFAGRHRTFALDFRGHGASERTPGRYGLADYVADAERLLDAIGAPAIVVGHSLGGVVAASLAQDRHPL